MTGREKVLDSCRRICSGVTDSEETVSRSKEFANCLDFETAFMGKFKRRKGRSWRITRERMKALNTQLKSTVIK